MTQRIRGFLLLAMGASLAAGTSPLPAQQPAAAAAPAANACPLDLLQPGPLGIASLQRQKVMASKTAEEATKGIKDAMKLLYDDKTKSNPLGRDMLVGQFLVLGMPLVETSTRGNLGLPGDKNAAVDLPTFVDSLFTGIEKAQPVCESETEQWRQYKWYPAKIQAAYKALSANQGEEAEKLAKRALVMSRSSAQGYDILWRVAMAREDEVGQLTNLRIAADKLLGDTLNSNVRSNLLYNLGKFQQDWAKKKQGDAKAKQFHESGVTLMQEIKEFPSAAETPFSVGLLSMGFTIAKDTAQAIEVLSLLKANSAKVSDVALAQAALLATRLSRTPDALALFEAASKINPYQRDYLYNYAAMLYDSKRADEMPAVLHNLVAIDPSNPENFALYAFAFARMSEGEKDAVKKKALTDSALAYNKISDGMPHRVSYTEFNRDADKTQLKGQIENKSAKERSFTIEFDFLDKTGASIGKASATVGPVKANDLGEFAVEIPKGGAWGVRYAALPVK
jgi:tetratricopeptide (TPR) repeat protein